MLPDRVGGVEAVGTAGQQGKGLFLVRDDYPLERRFELVALPLFLARGQPVDAAERIEKAAQVSRRFFDLLKQRGRSLDLGNVGVRHLFDLLHALGCVFGGLDGGGGGETAQPRQLLPGVVDAQADERVAAAQVVVEEGERRADGEAVQPQRDLGQLDRERVLVDAVDAALEHHAADDGLVGELGFVDDPIGGLGAVEDLAADRFDAVDQGRTVEAVEPGNGGRGVFDQLGDGVGEVVDRGDQEVAAAHGGVEDLEFQGGFGRVVAAQLAGAGGLGAAARFEQGRVALEALTALVDERAERALDDQVDERLGRVEAAAVLAGVAVGPHRDFAVLAAHRFALEQALVDGAELLDGHVAVVDVAAAPLRPPCG